jgi:hypothetical protein
MSKETGTIMMSLAWQSGGRVIVRWVEFGGTGYWGLFVEGKERGGFQDREDAMRGGRFALKELDLDNQV